MKKLKTIDDLNNMYGDSQGKVSIWKLKAEAIKELKELKRDGSDFDLYDTESYIKWKNNIPEADLKEGVGK